MYAGLYAGMYCESMCACVVCACRHAYDMTNVCYRMTLGIPLLLPCMVAYLLTSKRLGVLLDF